MTRGDFVHGRRDESLFDMVFRCVIFFFNPDVCSDDEVLFYC